MPESSLALLTIAGTILLGAMSPGPSFIMIVRTSVSASRKSALAAAAGMGVGCMIFSVMALAGLHSLLTFVPWLYTALKIAGGAYLIWLSISMLFRPQSNPIGGPAGISEVRPGRAFLTGMGTQLSNPNTAIVFGSIFAAILNREISSSLYIILPLIAFAVDTLWYALVALLLSSSHPRRIYMSYRRWLDVAGGLVMGYLGIKLIFR